MCHTTYIDIIVLHLYDLKNGFRSFRSIMKIKYDKTILVPGCVFVYVLFYLLKIHFFL